MIDFTNQVAIITGAVGNLGHATATALQKAGTELGPHPFLVEP